MAAALADYVNQDQTTRAVAARHGISTSTLTVWAKKAGIPLRNRGRRKRVQPTPRQLEILEQARMYKYHQVGNRFGLHKQSVHRLVKRWKDWVLPKMAPFSPGDMIRWRGKNFTVLDATSTEATLVDEGGMIYKNFTWSSGTVPKKIGTGGVITQVISPEGTKASLKSE